MRKSKKKSRDNQDKVHISRFKSMLLKLQAAGTIFAAVASIALVGITLFSYDRENLTSERIRQEEMKTKEINNKLDDIKRRLFQSRPENEIAEVLDSSDISYISSNNIGWFYQSFNDYDSALAWYHKGLPAKEASRKRVDLAVAYNNIAWIHQTRGNYDSALVWYNKSLEVQKALGNQGGLAMTYFNIATLYKNRGNYQESLELFRRCELISKEINDSILLSISYHSIADVYNNLGNYKAAREYLDRSLAISRKIGYEKGMRETEKLIKQVEEKKKN